MTDINQRTVGVVDPVLTTNARGYSNAEFVASRLFPRVTAPARNGRVLKFGRTAFRRVNTRRAPGSQVKRIIYGHGSDPISIPQEALEGVVPYEWQDEADRTMPSLDLGAQATQAVIDNIDLGNEIDSASLARDASNYASTNKLTLVGSDRWTDPDSTPIPDIRDAKEHVRRQIGRYPNVMLGGPSGINSLAEHPSVLDRYKYTQGGVVTEQMLAAVFGLDAVVKGPGIWLPETAGEDDPGIDIWGDDVILAYVPREGQRSYMLPSYGYTYELSDSTSVEVPYYDRTVKSWIYPTTIHRRPYLTGADAGFLFKGAGGAPA